MEGNQRTKPKKLVYPSVQTRKQQTVPYEERRGARARQKKTSGSRDEFPNTVTGRDEQQQQLLRELSAGRWLRSNNSPIITCHYQWQWRHSSSLGGTAAGP